MTILERLQSNGIRRLGRPKVGFRYRDVQGKAVTGADRKRIDALKIPPAWTDVAINPSPALVRPIGLERFPIVRSVRLQADVRRPTEAGRYEVVKTALTATSVLVEPPASTVTQWPALSEPPLDGPTVLGAPAPPQIPEQTRVEPHPSATADNTPSADTKTRTPWTTAADVGVALGRGSQNAGVATAGFFSRVAKKVAGSF